MVLVLPPAATWSGARHFGTRGQPPVRSRAQPWGITDTTDTPVSRNFDMVHRTNHQVYCQDGTSLHELKSSNIGSGALVIQCKVATMTHPDNSVVPKWNKEPSTLDAFEERVILYVLGTKKEERYLCGPRLLAQMDPERQPCKVVKSAVTTTQLAAEGGATLVIAALRLALGARPIQEAVRLFRQLMGLRDMRRQSGESMRKWTSRFEAFIRKTGKALHQADAEIDESTFLHPLIQGILLLECSNLSPAENAAVLATSGATTKEGGSIGNSYLYVDLAASFIAQWDDEALMRRDKAPPKRSHHSAAAAITTWELSSPSNTFLEPDTVDGGELEMALGTCDETWEDQSWEEPEETEFPEDDWTDEFPPDDPELEDQFGSLEAAEAYAVTEFKNAS